MFTYCRIACKSKSNCETIYVLAEKLISLGDASCAKE